MKDPNRKIKMWERSAIHGLDDPVSHAIHNFNLTVQELFALGGKKRVYVLLMNLAEDINNGYDFWDFE